MTVPIRNFCLLLALLTTISIASGQYCDCSGQFEFVVQYIEHNNPAYQTLIADPEQLTVYTTKKDSLTQLAMLTDSLSQCIDVLNNYLLLLRDHHTKVSMLNVKNAPSKNSQKIYEYKSIADSVSYIKLTSFNITFVDTINKFFDSIEIMVASHPYLIIDLRDNGGGADEAWYGLMKFIYTEPVMLDDVDIWVTPDNLQYYDKYYKNDKRLIRRLHRQKPNSFMLMSGSRVTDFGLKTASAMPQRVVILQNKQVASTSEDLILIARQSTKVITMGTNTGGYTGYGNISFTKLPDTNLLLTSTTTRYRQGSKFEFIGIPPMVNLTTEMDWINEALEQFKK